ncbi:MAG: ABC transporter permease [Planctomycetota bacterium]
MRYWELMRMAFDGLRRTRLRTTLTTLGVAIASAALVALVAFAIGLQRQVERPFKALALLNNIIVSSGDEEDSPAGPPLNDAALKKMLDIPGVVAAYPDIRMQGVTLRAADKQTTALAVGIPHEAAFFGIEEDLIVAGNFFSPKGTRETIIGAELVEELGFKSAEDAVGKQLVLESGGLKPDEGGVFTFQRERLEVSIVGVYEPPPLMPGLARRAVLLPTELMKEVPGVRFEAALKRMRAGGDAAAAAYNTATVRVADPADLDRVASAVAAMGFKTRTVASRLRGMRTFFVVLQVMLAALGTVALIVAALGIVNTLVMSVLERYREIGLYKAIGASDGDLLAIFLAEAAALGLFGGLLGLLLGRAVSWALESAVNVYARDQGATEHVDLFAFPLWLAASTVLFAVIVSVLAGIYPAMRAARVDPIRALRSE